MITRLTQERREVLIDALNWYRGHTDNQISDEFQELRKQMTLISNDIQRLGDVEKLPQQAQRVEHLITRRAKILRMLSFIEELTVLDVGSTTFMNQACHFGKANIELALSQYRDRLLKKIDDATLVPVEGTPITITHEEGAYTRKKIAKLTLELLDTDQLLEYFSNKEFAF
jgi:hypothetical protein